MYSGKLASLSSVALGDMAQGEAHRYRFSVSLPADAGDSYQGASSAVTFLWSATAPEPDVDAHADPAGVDRRAPRHDARPRNDGRRLRRRRPRPAARSSLGATFIAPGRARRPRAARSPAPSPAPATCRGRRERDRRRPGRAKVKLKPVTRTLTKGKRLSVTVTLPTPARLALAAGRPVTVRLNVRAKVGTRVITVRRTVRVMPASR